MKAKVKNMTSVNGNDIPNQFIIRAGKYEYFQSYNSIIARTNVNTGETVLDSYYWDYSVTTGKYRNQFLGEDIQETRRKIKEGIYKLTDLNK